jgi:hypothetical protein
LKVFLDLTCNRIQDEEADEAELPRIRRAIEPDGSADVGLGLDRDRGGGSGLGRSNNEYVYMTSPQLSLMQACRASSSCPGALVFSRYDGSSTFMPKASAWAPPRRRPLALRLLQVDQ